MLIIQLCLQEQDAMQQYVKLFQMNKQGSIMLKDSKNKILNVLQ